MIKKINNSENNAISIISRDINIDEELFKDFDQELRNLVKKYEILASENNEKTKCHIFSVCLNQG